METLKVASIAWKIRSITSEHEFFGHLDELLRSAHSQGAELSVLPELPVLELLHLHPDADEAHVPAILSEHAMGYQSAITKLSKELGMTIVGGSHFFASGSKIHNLAVVSTPDGFASTHIKNNLTNYERVSWRLGRGISLGRCDDHRLGITICYDSEFPEAVRLLAENGVLLLAVPAFTETIQGFQRVRWCSLARAVENQIFVIHSSLVGSLGREPIPSAVGSSAIIAPSVQPFPDKAILAETEMGEEGVAVAEIDFQQLFEARASGDVRNWQDRKATEWRL